mmetsp:Transcript_39879/g.106534  ORF Transcript_39879/g.106534 Transcript_39879/m.106534 type:complete len:285 (+) Transcript_39879:657-1511(+)
MALFLRSRLVSLLMPVSALLSSDAPKSSKPLDLRSRDSSVLNLPSARHTSVSPSVTWLPSFSLLRSSMTRVLQVLHASTSITTTNSSCLDNSSFSCNENVEEPLAWMPLNLSHSLNCLRELKFDTAAAIMSQPFDLMPLSLRSRDVRQFRPARTLLTSAAPESQSWLALRLRVLRTASLEIASHTTFASFSPMFSLLRSSIVRELKLRLASPSAATTTISCLDSWLSISLLLGKLCKFPFWMYEYSRSFSWDRLLKLDTACPTDCHTAGLMVLSLRSKEERLVK